MGTFITLLIDTADPWGEEAPTEGGTDDPARHVPTTNSYENLSDLPLNVGGRTEGSLMVYVSDKKVI